MWRTKRWKVVPEEVELLCHNSEACGLAQVQARLADEIASVQQVLHLRPKIRHSLRTLADVILIQQIDRWGILLQIFTHLPVRVCILNWSRPL